MLVGGPLQEDARLQIFEPLKTERPRPAGCADLRKIHHFVLYVQTIKFRTSNFMTFDMSVLRFETRPLSVEKLATSAYTHSWELEVTCVSSH